jgi:hypothetical protein
MSDNTVQVQFTANTASLEAGAQRAASAIQKVADTVASAGAAGEAGSAAISEAAQAVEQAGASATTAAPQLQQAADAISGNGSAATGAAPAVAQVATAVQQAGSAAATAAPALQQAAAAQQQLVTATAASTAAIHNSAASQQAMAAAAQAIRDRIDPLSAANRRYGAEVGKVNGLVAAGALTQQEGAAAIALATAAHEKEIAAIERATKSHGGLLGALGKNRAALMEVEHSARASADALAAGASPMRILSMEGPRLVQALSEVNGISLAAIATMAAYAAAVIAVGGSFIYAVSHAETVAQQFGAIDAAMEATGRSSDYTRERIVGVVDQLRSLNGVSTEAAIAMVGALARQRTIGVGAYVDIGRAAAGFARVAGVDVVGAQRKLTEALNGGYDSLRKLDEQWQFLTPEQAEAARHFAETGDQAGFLSLAVGALKDKFGDLVEAGLTPAQKATNDLGVAWDHLMHAMDESEPIRKARQDLADFLDGFARGIDPTGLNSLKSQLADLTAKRETVSQNMGGWLGNSPEELADLDKDIAKVKELIAAKEAAAKAGTEGAAASGDPTTELQKKALDLYHGLNAAASQREKIEAQIAEFQKAQIGASAAVSADLQKGIDADKVKLQSLKDSGGQNVVQGFQDELDQRIAAENKFGEAAKQVELKFWQDKAALIRQGADQTNGEIEAGSRAAYQIEQHVYELRQQLNREGVSDAHKASTEQSRALEEWWRDYSEGMQQLISAASANSAEQIRLTEAWVATGEQLYGQDTAKYREALNEKDRLTKESTQKQIEAASEWSRGQSELAQSGLQGQIDALDEQVSLGQVSADQRYAIEAQLYDKVHALRRQDLQDQMANYAAGSKEALAAYDQILAEDQRYQNEKAQLARKEATEEQQQAKEIADTLSSSLMGMLTGRQNFTQTALHLVDQLAEHEIQKVLETVVEHVMGETTKTVATTTGTATRTAVDQASNSSFLGRVATQVAEWLGLETGKTAASVSGEAARTAAVASATATDLAATKTAAVADATSWAAVAATAAMASVAAIPIVGWAMAPGVGASVLAEGMGFAALASAAGGYDIPAGVNPVTQLHEREMVLPKQYADTIRSLAANSNAPAGNLSYAGLPSSSFASQAGRSSAAEMIRNVMSSTTNNDASGITIKQTIHHTAGGRQSDAESLYDAAERGGRRGALAVRRAMRG